MIAVMSTNAVAITAELAFARFSPRLKLPPECRARFARTPQCQLRIAHSSGSPRRQADALANVGLAKLANGLLRPIGHSVFRASPARKQSEHAIEHRAAHGQKQSGQNCCGYLHFHFDIDYCRRQFAVTHGISPER